MQFSDNRLVRRFAAGVAAVALAALAACSGGSSTAPKPEDPILPGNPPSTPQLQNSAFVFDVDMRSKKVTVTGPKNAVTRSVAGAAAAASTPSYSILSNDVIDVATSNFSATTVGQYAPNKVRVFFDVVITNKITGINLITPTFPVAPSGQNGVILFPFSTNVTTTAGGTATEGGNTVIIDLPSRGEVAPSLDWNGSATPDNVAVPGLPGVGGDPYNFFNDASCTATPAPGTTSDCYRYETFGAIPGGATSIVRRVGFDIDATVGQFRARLIAAADIQASTGPAVGTIAGSVTSTQRGALSGVTVNVSGGATGTTATGGAYSIANVGVGTRTVSLANLPSGCTAPTAQTTTVSSGATSTVNFSVTCTADVGTVSGNITLAGAGTSQTLSGVTVTLVPAVSGTPSSLATLTAATGAYTGSVAIGLGAGAGSGTIVLGNLPNGCAAPSPTPAYTGLTANGSVTVNISVTCVAPAQLYTVDFQWGTPTATSVQLDVFFDPTTGPQPFNVASIQGVLALTGSAAARLGTPSAVAGEAAASGATFAYNFNAANYNPANGVFLNASAIGARARVRVLSFTFPISAGAAGSVTTNASVTTAADEDANTTTPAQRRVNQGTLTLP